MLNVSNSINSNINNISNKRATLVAWARWEMNDTAIRFRQHNKTTRGWSRTHTHTQNSSTVIERTRTPWRRCRAQGKPWQAWPFSCSTTTWANIRNRQVGKKTETAEVSYFVCACLCVLCQRTCEWDCVRECVRKRVLVQRMGSFILCCLLKSHWKSWAVRQWWTRTPVASKFFLQLLIFIFLC